MPILQIISVVVALLLGVIVVLRNPADRNRWFLLLFNASVCFWIVSYIFADIVGDYSLFWNRVIFLATHIITFIAYLLISSLSKRLSLKALIPGIALLVWAIIVMFTPFIVEDVTPRMTEGGLVTGLNVVRGWGYPFFVVSLVIAAGSVVGYVLHLSRKSRGRFKTQLKIIFAGFAGMLLVGLTTGILLPLLLKTSAPANYSFLSALIVIGAFTYAIIQQRFFDLRLAIARSLGYLLTLTITAVFYVIAIFSIGDILFKNDMNSARIYYIIAALFVAITFQPLRKFINRLTRQIFFRDTYETKAVLDKLTSFLVRTVDLESLTSKSAKILNDAVRVDFLQIVLIKKAGKYHPLLQKLSSARDWPLVTDEMIMQHNHLAGTFSDNNIALVSRLRTPQEVVGYIICGPKSRGDVLTSQDIDLIRIASGELAVAIQNSLRFEAILNFNETLKQEITEATAELRESNLKLQKLDQAKDEFISMASHQLRTPLTSVKGYLSMILEGDVGKVGPEQHKLLQEAYSSAQRMVYLIGDFLNVSRLRTGKFVIERSLVVLPRIVKEEIEQLAATAARRNIRLECHLPTHFPEVELDDNKIRQVVMNLIDNAIFYSKPNSAVCVELLATSKDVSFKVHDTGIGVPENERHNIFTKFFRASNARKVRPDGTGIGLFMAKKVIIAHGGSIIFETKLNKGSTFGFTLPLAAKKLTESAQK